MHREWRVQPCLGWCVVVVSLLIGCGTSTSEEAADTNETADGGADVEAADTSSGQPDGSVPEVLPTGAPCSSTNPCGGDSVCNEAWPDGYCTSWSCRGGITRCPGDGVCDIVNDVRNCLDACEEERDCREGYSCLTLESGRLACAPTQPTSRTEAGGPGGDMVCYGVPETGVVTVPVPALPDALSTAVVFYSDAGRVAPQSITLDTGETITLFDTEWLDGTVGYRVAFNVAQVSFPFLPPGRPEVPVSATVKAQALGELCVRVWSRASQGSELTLNVYLNTLAGESAASPPAYVSRAFLETGRILDDVGINLTTNYLELDPEMAERYRIIRDNAALDGLVSESYAPPTVSTLSLNVFLVDGLFPESAVIGISRGIPGPSGVHGTKASGVVISGEYLREGGAGGGTVIAHEIGHFLGLFHTTEQSRTRFDPLDDTGECEPGMSDFVNPRECDTRNLMWPWLESAAGNLTRDQSWVLRRNPLVRSVP